MRDLESCINGILFNYVGMNESKSTNENLLNRMKERTFYFSHKDEIINYFKPLVTESFPVNEEIKIEFYKDEVDKIDFQDYFYIKQEDRSEKLLNQIRDRIKGIYDCSRFKGEIKMGHFSIENAERVYYYTLNVKFRISRTYLFKKYYIMEKFETYKVEIKDIDKKYDEIKNIILNKEIES